MADTEYKAREKNTVRVTQSNQTPMSHVGINTHEWQLGKIDHCEKQAASKNKGHFYN